MDAAPQAYAYTGDDPVNGVDPSGLSASGCDSAPNPEKCSEEQQAQNAPRCPGGSHVVGGQCTGTGAGQPCPDVAANGITCLSARWNANNSFSAGTSGLCIAGGSFYVGGVFGSLCLVWNATQVGVTLTGGVGAGGGLGVSGGFESSNTSCINNLGGDFFETGGGLGYASGFVASNGKTTVGYGGFGPTYGVQGYAGKSKTFVFGF